MGFKPAISSVCNNGKNIIYTQRSRVKLNNIEQWKRKVGSLQRAKIEAVMQHQLQGHHKNQP